MKNSPGRKQLRKLIKQAKDDIGKKKHWENTNHQMIRKQNKSVESI